MLKLETRVWTVRDLMRFSIDLLQKRGFEETRLNVELLLAHALQCSRLHLYTNSDKPLTKEEFRSFRDLYERRLNREPVQYIIGTTSFMGLTFNVDSRVLIPRPETETLVEQAMMICRGAPTGIMRLLDVGTGSGNIAISIAKFCRNVEVVAIDTSKKALEIAQENAERHGVVERIDFQQLDIFEPLDQLLLRRFDLLVSNPPYVSLEEYETLAMEVRRFEPKGAVSDGRDGYEFHRRLVEIAPYLLVEDGALIVELGYGQHQTVNAMMLSAGFENVSVTPDLQGIPRVIRATVHSMTRNKGPVN
jgi:release factor glutamine methyltransferase